MDTMLFLSSGHEVPGFMQILAAVVLEWKHFYVNYFL